MMRKLNVIQFDLREIKKIVISHCKLKCDPEEAVFLKVDGCQQCENNYTDSDKYEISWRKK